MFIMTGKIRNLNREIETTKIIIIEQKNTISKIKIFAEWDQHRMNRIEERINELKDRPVEITQLEEQRKKI